MKYSNGLNHYLEAYEEYKVKTLNPSHSEIQNRLKAWEKPEYWNKYTTGAGVATPSPIRMIMSRVKHPEKVVDKIYRKSKYFPKGLSIESLRDMHDAIGVRVIVYFTSQLPLIDKELRSSEIFEISESSPPEAYMNADILTSLGLSHIERKYKESGYSSIHYTVKLKESSIPETEKPNIEIQVRTLAQELWCELEHVLSYKPEHRTNLSAKHRLQILSREVGVVDEHFNLLYEDLIHNQEIASYQDSDILNFENAPKVLMEIGLQCSLTDLNPILKILFSREITTIGDLLKIASPRRLATIRNNYISSLGHAPDNVLLIAALASLKGAKTKEIEMDRIKSQIEYHKKNKQEEGR